MFFIGKLNKTNRENGGQWDEKRLLISFTFKWIIPKSRFLKLLKYKKKKWSHANLHKFSSDVIIEWIYLWLNIGKSY